VCTFDVYARAQGPSLPVEVVASGRSEDVPPLAGDGIARIRALRPVLGMQGLDLASAPAQLVVDHVVEGTARRFEIAFLADANPNGFESLNTAQRLLLLPFVPVIDLGVPLLSYGLTLPLAPLILYGRSYGRAAAYGRARGCACVERPFAYVLYGRDGPESGCYAPGPKPRY
jgi:hypothetical protein